MKVLNLAAVLKCSHGGTLQISPQSVKLRVAANEVLMEQHIISALIAGCPQSGSGITPCTAVTQITAGQATKLTINSQPVLLDTLAGITNGNPPGTLVVVAPGQQKLDSV